MRNIIILLLMIVCLKANSQNGGTKDYYKGSLMISDPTASSGNAMNGNMIDPSWKAKVAQAGDAWKGGEIIIGSIFSNDEMNKGYIRIQGEKNQRDISLRYNVYSHEKNFLKEKTELVLDPAIPVEEFGYSISTEDGSKNLVFRSGYPPIGKNSTQTFYEVVAGKDIALLKYTVKRILEKKDEHGQAEKVVVDADTWYVYDNASRTIAETKKNKNAVLQALPQYAIRIREITEANSLRLKSDADWTILFTALAAK